MRTALRSKSSVPQGQVSRTYPRDAPIKGWMANENIADMDEDAAFVMDNWFPETNSIRVRNGSLTYATLPSATDPVQSLMVYNAGGVQGIFAAQVGKIYDVTAGGAAGAAVLTGQHSDKYISLNFSTSGGTFHNAANGADHPINYNGTTWQATPAITGVTGGASSLNYVFAYKNRLFFLQNLTSIVWYLQVDSIGGAANPLAIGGQLSLGGTLAAGCVLTVDSGLGPNDYCCFVSTEGEVVVYSGDDPSDATVWALRGVYRISRPIGQRCLLRIGADVAVLCADGVVSLTQAMQVDIAAAQKAAFSWNIRDYFADQYELTGQLFGWDLISWPSSHMAIVNVPTSVDGTTSVQFVMNVLSGAWSRYLGMNALCLALAQNIVYYGTADGKVIQFEKGNNDNGSTIYAITIPAFSQMKAPGVIKVVKDAQLFVRAVGSYVIGINAAVDFQTPIDAASMESIGSTSGALWDSAIWDTAVWGGSSSNVQMVWLDLGESGYYLAPVFLLQTGDTSGNDNDFRLLTCNLLYEIGAVVG